MCVRQASVKSVGVLSAAELSSHPIPHYFHGRTTEGLVETCALMALTCPRTWVTYHRSNSDRLRFEISAQPQRMAG